MYDNYKIDVITYKNDSIKKDVFNLFSKSNFYYFSSNFKGPQSITFLKRLISPTLPGFSSHNARSIANDIDNLISRKRNYDFIYFATQLMGQAKFYLNSKIYSIIDLYDIYTTYSISKYKELHFYRFHYWLFRIEAIRIKRLEQKIIKIFDLLCVTCEENARYVKILDSNANVIEISNGTILPNEISICKGDSILMVGNFEYAGNFEGIKWFLENVWSFLKEKTDSNLVLVGKYPEDLKHLVTNDKQIHLAGLVPDLKQYYMNAGCVILPLFNDGGTKTKLIEAMAYGIPIVSTTIGAKGFESIQTIHKTDNPKKFSEFILKVFTNDFQDNSLITTQKFVIENYSWEIIGKQLNNYLKNIPVNGA